MPGSADNESVHNESSTPYRSASYDNELRTVLQFIEEYCPVGDEPEDHQLLPAGGGEPNTGTDHFESSETGFTT